MFNKRSFISILLIASLGLATGLFLRNVRLNGVKADIDSATQKIIEKKGKLTNINSAFWLQTDTVTIKVLSSSPSLDLNYFIDQNVLITGFIQTDTLIAIAADQIN